MLAFKWGGESLLDRYYSTWRWVPNNVETVPRSLIFGHCGHDKGGEYLSCGWFNYQWSWCYSLNGRECWADELQTRFGFHTSGYWSNLQCQFKSNHDFGNMTLCWLRLKLLEPSIVRELQPEHSLSWTSRARLSSVHLWITTDRTRYYLFPQAFFRSPISNLKFSESHQHLTVHRKLAYETWHRPWPWNGHKMES